MGFVALAMVGPGAAHAQGPAATPVTLDPVYVRMYAGYIQHAIAGHGADDPVSVADIVEDIDWSQRTGIDLEELNAGLGLLIEQGAIAELPGFRYHEPDQPPAVRVFTPVTAQHFDEVMAERAAFWEPILNAPDPATSDPSEPAWPKLRVVATFDARAVDGGYEVDVDSVGRASGLIDLLAAALIDAGIPARPGPMTDPLVGPEMRLDAFAFVRILYGPRDVDPQEMLAIARPVFDREAPPGSELSVQDPG